MKEKIIKETVKLLENMSNNIGEKINEYHWREFQGIILQLKECFPEYKLEEYLINLHANIEPSFTSTCKEGAETTGTDTNLSDNTSKSVQQPNYKKSDLLHPYHKLINGRWQPTDKNFNRLKI